MVTRVQQSLLCYSPRGDKADDTALHQPAPAFTRQIGGRVQLFANRDIKAFVNQRTQIAVGRMVWHPAHLDIFALMFAAFGEGDIQHLCRHHRVIKEHFIKITHAIKQQAIWIVAFDIKELRDHRGCVVGHSIKGQAVFRCELLGVGY